MSADLRLGRWQDVLADVECDALICDPPYSARTHDGARAITADGIVEGVGQYAHLTDDDVRELVAAWSDRCRGWMVFATDDVIGPVFRDAADAAGRYAFPLLPVLQQQPRVCGDGPSQHGHYLAVSRPRRREFLSWGSLPGWYEAPREKGEIRGAKPIGLMSAIVRDYSRPGDLVCDPFCGSGTTALAALSEGRRFVGSEQKPEHYEIARRRLDRGYTPTMF
jgi:site-specific DNA-methyltransferase (adenine-specific)